MSHLKAYAGFSKLIMKGIFNPNVLWSFDKKLISKLVTHASMYLPLYGTSNPTYCKIASSNSSRLEAHVGFFRLLMKVIFGPYVLWPFDKKFIF
jgi:hypothetical protein